MLRLNLIRGGATKGRKLPLSRHGITAKGKSNGTVEYACWKAMWARCSNPNNDRWHRYGGRGIRVADRWRSFEAFLADLGKRPSPNHSIDRLDNDGNYEPSNCAWRTRKQQAANRSKPERRAA